MPRQAPDHDTRETEPPNFEFGQHAMGSITQLILEAQAGRRDAWDQVYAALYKELHQAAGIQIRRRWRAGGRSATSLINRTWLRLDQNALTLNSRQHLVALLSRAMRYALLDEARRLNTAMREEHFDQAEVDNAEEPAYDPELDQLVALDGALDALAAADPRLGQLVEMRYFAGMTEIEIANVLGVTDRTIRRAWRKARAFLAAHLDGAPGIGEVEQTALP